MRNTTESSPWLVAGVRTPFAKVDGALRAFDAIELSVPVAQGMFDQQAAKELSGMAPGSQAVVSICADGGQGTVALLEAP